SNWAVAGGLGQASFSTDGGQTWSASTFTPGITAGGTLATNRPVESAFAASAALPANNAVVYASVNNNSGSLYVSTNGGQTFTGVNAVTNYLAGGSGSQGWYDNTLWVSPVNSSFVVVGGIDLWRSTDG